MQEPYPAWPDNGLAVRVRRLFGARRLTAQEFEVEFGVPMIEDGQVAPGACVVTIAGDAAAFVIKEDYGRLCKWLNNFVNFHDGRG